MSLYSVLFLQTALVGPVLHIWYSTLFRIIPGPGIANIVKRVTLDQFGFAPVFITTFISSNLVLMGNAEQVYLLAFVYYVSDVVKVIPKLKADVVSTVLTNNAVWIPAQFINLGIVPPQYQVLFANFVGLFWNTYLSWVTFQEADHKTIPSQTSPSRDKLEKEPTDKR